MIHRLQEKLGHWPGTTLSVALIAVAIMTVLIAVYVHNPWVKAGVLAYEILP